jgi:hypothetical protein
VEKLSSITPFGTNLRDNIGADTLDHDPGMIGIAVLVEIDDYITRQHSVEWNLNPCIVGQNLLNIFPINDFGTPGRKR